MSRLVIDCAWGRVTWEDSAVSVEATGDLTPPEFEARVHAALSREAVALVDVPVWAGDHIEPRPQTVRAPLGSLQHAAAVLRAALPEPRLVELR